MRLSRGKARLRADAAVAAIAIVMLACPGCFNTSVPVAPRAVARETPAWMKADDKAETDAIAAAKKAQADEWTVCTPAVHRSIDDCDKVCMLFDAGSEKSKKEALEKFARQQKQALDIATAPRDPSYREVIDRLSPVCVQQHLRECGVVEILQSKTLDSRARADGVTKFAAQIDPACDAAARFAGEKYRDMEDAFAKSRRDADLMLPP